MSATTSRITAIERATNRGWDDWLTFMEGIGAVDLSHHEIATRVLEELMGELENPAWWAQSTTAAYEQFIGRRVPGQRPDGTFQTSVSRATPVAMTPLMDAWTAFAACDQDVLDLVAGELKIGGTAKRLTWRTKARDGSVINVISEPKGNGTASIVVQHLGSPTLERNTQVKELWSSILTRFLGDGLPVETS